MCEHLNNLLAQIRAAGFPVQLNWVAPRWEGDEGSARHYTIADDGNGGMPAVRNFSVTVYERGDGYALFAETPTSKIADDVTLLLSGLPDPFEDLLRELRAEVVDWQEALCGEREGLDELCARVDALLGGKPEPVPASLVLTYSPAEAEFIASALTVGTDDESHDEGDTLAAKTLVDALGMAAARPVTIRVEG